MTDAVTRVKYLGLVKCSVVIKSTAETMFVNNVIISMTNRFISAE